MIKQFAILVILCAWVSCKNEDPEPPVENWCMIFEDQFDSLNRTVWEPTIAPNGITSRTDRSENLRIENGLLIMELHKENYDGYAYTGSDIASIDYYQYGKIECRARLPKANIAWPAFWLLGSYDEYGAWPNCGEIDILEYWGYNAPDFYTNIHTKHSNWKNGKDRAAHSTSYTLSDATEEFHVYGMVWYRDRLEFYLDDNLYWTYHKIKDSWRKWPFDHPMRIVFQMYAGPDYHGSVADLPDQFEVDYVKVYEACD
ncbi:MAG: glycoside hydrolase family 16 protein [Cyclobacteriaceae bacterium]|nr:glycoside hydrolase family 16 protein [Cyclobacteriaceae bacterium]